MPTQPTVTIFNPTKLSHVAVGLEPATKGIKVSRETFRVSKSKKEIAEWFCQRHLVEPDHVHGKGSPCFTVVFDKKEGSPFTTDKYTSDKEGYAYSDEVVVNPDYNNVYHYHVYMTGKTPLDPGGAVDP